jgi:regulator of protease activity HflC (stomatin/prohibitin superfamily)
MTIFLIVLVVVVLIVWTLFLQPIWRVWASQKQGEADLQQAHKEQQIQVSKAQGRLDAAKLNKEAAVIEAEAVAAQIEKIGTNLKEHDLYLKWQWIKMMEERPESSVIYVPTEANLPILEAGKRADGKI